MTSCFLQESDQPRPARAVSHAASVEVLGGAADYGAACFQRVNFNDRCCKFVRKNEDPLCAYFCPVICENFEFP